MNFKRLAFILLFATVVLSCKDELPKTDIAVVKETVNNWNNGLNLHNVDTFGIYYADNLMYYGQYLSKNEVLLTKLNFINSNVDFKQIIVGDIDVIPTDNGTYKATFNKSAQYGSKKLDVIAFLELQKMSNNKWYIIVESDNITEEKIKKAEQAEKDKANQPSISDYKFEQKVTLTGVLSTDSYKDGLGDKLQVYILKLENPINVNAPNSNYDDLKGVQEIQVGFADDNNKKQYLNKTITLTGEIYGEETVNDRRPVVMIQAKVVE